MIITHHAIDIEKKGAIESDVNGVSLSYQIFKAFKVWMKIKNMKNECKYILFKPYLSLKALNPYQIKI